ncbi:protein JASON-like isoform X1 [Corylus avellana]|uniref:protein JASON-like isoform X1 n=1 Tax=Corylus avellana TaxID=13451 RepID=UPI001E212F75|nr:protein JASON-like isoform X1 [Corylus avellana]
MISSLLKRELASACRSVVWFLESSVSKGMGCFFACFRIRDDRHRPRPHLASRSASRPNPTEVVIPQNRLSSLFIAEENEDSRCNDGEDFSFRSPQNRKELKDEARFLKACGTLVETPAEIRKASLKGSTTYDRDSEPPKFHSWLPNTSIKKIQLDNQPDQPPTPIKLCEDWGKESASQELTPSSCISSVKVHANQSENATSVSPLVSTTAVQCRNKSVRFECEYDVSSSRSSSENVSHNPKKSESPDNRSVPKPEPYPTPLKLSDEMQTPGTVFPTNLEKLPYGKTRIRSQYVYSGFNPVESDSQLKVLKEENSNSHQFSDDLRESLELLETATPRSEGGVNETSSGKELKAEASQSAWLKPQLSTQDENSKLFDSGATRRPHFGRTPGDRPIIGIVAAHWNDDEPSHISPKWWDGNGIPNSTNKYKEDQKVSWHATPFEERLEKALSEESNISQRKDIYGKPIAFDENEENDTALSQLQSSAHPKSVVSF